MNDKGQSVEDNDTETVKLYKLIAAQDQSDVQLQLCNKYMNGQAADLDDTEVVKWRQAAT